MNKALFKNVLTKCCINAYVDILPTFFVHPTDKSITIKYKIIMISLTCEAIEASSYIWEKQNGSISHSAHGVNNNTLRFTDLQYEDAGYYRCRAINNAGESFSKYASISITGKIFLYVVCSYV